MRQFAFLFLLAFLVACDGYKYDNSDPDSGSDTELKFTAAELEKKILFSEAIQESNIVDGYILRFVNSAELEQIKIKDTTSALSGDYDWTISNHKLQVTYPSAIVCTTTKDKDDNLKYETTGTCTAGTKNNETIDDDLIRPLAFAASDLSNDEITIDLGNNQQEVLKFDSNGTNFSLTKKNNGQASNPENGTFKTSLFTNVIRLNIPNVSTYRLLIIVKDSLTDGTLVELTYGSADEKLKGIRVYSSSNNEWKLEKHITTIEQEST